MSDWPTRRLQRIDPMPDAPSPRLSDERLAKIEDAARRAEPGVRLVSGPYHYRGDDYPTMSIDVAGGLPVASVCAHHEYGEGNTDLMAETDPEALLSMIAELRSLRASPPSTDVARAAKWLTGGLWMTPEEGDPTPEDWINSLAREFQAVREEGRVEEREACAKVAGEKAAQAYDAYRRSDDPAKRANPYYEGAADEAERIEAAIRERSTS